MSHPVDWMRSIMVDSASARVFELDAGGPVAHLLHPRCEVFPLIERNLGMRRCGIDDCRCPCRFDRSRTAIDHRSGRMPPLGTIDCLLLIGSVDVETARTENSQNTHQFHHAHNVRTVSGVR
jgi:hypothetical protein